jgi:hypothetical protein
MARPTPVDEFNAMMKACANTRANQVSRRQNKAKEKELC